MSEAMVILYSNPQVGNQAGLLEELEYGGFGIFGVCQRHLGIQSTRIEVSMTTGSLTAVISH